MIENSYSMHKEGKFWVLICGNKEALRVTKEDVWGAYCGGRKYFNRVWADEALKKIHKDGFYHVAYLMTGDKKYRKPVEYFKLPSGKIEEVQKSFNEAATDFSTIWFDQEIAEREK